MYYWKIFGLGYHVYHENICCGSTCPVGVHVLWYCAKAASIEVAVSLGSWCFFFFFFFLHFFFVLFFFALRHAFQGYIVENVLFEYVGLLLYSAWLLLFLKIKLSSCMLGI